MTLALLQRSTDLGVVRVLLVEDNDGDARLVELMLQGTFGSEVQLSRARTLAEALELVATEKPVCVVLDLGLPDAEGLEGVRRIKAQAPLIAVVVLTGAADEDLGTAAVEQGAQDYLVKGNTIDETLTRSIRYAVVRKNGEDALLRSQQSLAEAQHIARLGSWELDLADNTMLWSAELCRLYGYETSPGAGFEDYLDRLHPDDAVSVEARLRAAISAREPFDLDHRVVVPGREVRWVRSQGRVESLGTGVAAWMRGTAQDITEQKQAEDALSHQALHDDLTGLPNRILLLDRLRHALAELTRDPSTLGLLFIDVDRFKVLNDSLGHAAGDAILRAMAARLLLVLRPGDTLARFGGDEFVLLCKGLSGEADALGIAERIAVAMTEPLNWGEGDLIMTVSTGIALTSSPHTSGESLLRDADTAMYRAKEAGRSRSAVFAEPMRGSAVRRLETELSLRQALAEGELEVYYQPIVDLPGGRITGTEALVRWQHPIRGLVGPDEFIPIAEETGLIIPLGAWVLREAVRQTMAWHELEGCADLSVAVNLSAAQLKRVDLIDTVESVLRDTGMAPSLLKLEITESVLMDEAARSERILHALKALGVKLSIDDFGTGYSSLSYLKRFPVDAVKIDRAFVDGLGEDAADSAIVDAVVRMADALQLDTIAEGVETPLQMRELIQLGCRSAQGYLFARPQPAAELLGMLEDAVGLAPVASTIADPPCERLDPTADTVLDFTRRLLWIDSTADVAEIAHDLVAALGGTTVPALSASSDALPVDVSFGETGPVLPVAEPHSVARMLLERHLPAFSVDAHRAIELAARNVRLTEDANIDVLTGLPNRRSLHRLLAHLAPETTLVAIDLDHFKAVNDRFGHLEGDRVLCAFGRTLASTLRTGDHAGRFGGEEFLVALAPGSAPDPFLTRLRSAWEAARPQPTTFSAGIASSRPDPVQAARAADVALYRAKAEGRDQWQWAAAGDYP
ncbi:MAG: diguanylate cyclase domain protein [Ilumatobacteraceae bacterium]|nr:diguanylate cyclase domain protein [Ilumatobacteraceae bacterium]